MTAAAALLYFTSDDLIVAKGSIVAGQRNRWIQVHDGHGGMPENWFVSTRVGTVVKRWSLLRCFSLENCVERDLWEQSG